MIGRLRERLAGRRSAVAADAGPELTPAAVLVPLVERGGEPAIVLTERNAALRAHAGQISFPGGKVDARDADRAATARREALEELGIAEVEILGLLDETLTPTGFRITPVVGVLPPAAAFRPNAVEVASVFEVPLARLRDPAVLEDLGDVERFGRVFRVYNYRIDGRNIWGATARILRQLLGMLDAPP